jgi:hypothetical protein
VQIEKAGAVAATSPLLEDWRPPISFLASTQCVRVKQACQSRLYQSMIKLWVFDP